MHLVYAIDEPEVLQCESGTPGYSFYFDLIFSLWQGCMAEGAIHGMCSLMRKMGARTLVKEKLQPNNEITQELDDIRTRIQRDFTETPEAWRISFFAASCDGNDWSSIPASSFLGYAVVICCKLPTDIEIVQKMCPTGGLSYILEAVTRPPGWPVEQNDNTWDFRSVTNYYIHCCRNFDSTIGTTEKNKEYAVEGVFFCQQNTFTHVCAHAVLRMILNTGVGLVSDKITNREINEILGINHRDRTAEKGLTPEQISRVARHYSLNILSGNLLTMPTVDYAEYIYPLIESGYPVLLCFCPTHTQGHVVAVLGHTLNSDKWDCEAHLAYRPEAFGKHHASSTWVDHFIVNDDNFGMYHCMPTSYLRNIVLPQYDYTQRANHVMAFLPAEANVPPYLAEKAAISLIHRLKEVHSPPDTNRWLIRLWEQVSLPNRGVVARTFMCRKDNYIESLIQESGIDSDGNGPIVDIPQRLSSAPENLWVTEISLPDLYTANKHKIGDVLTDAQAGSVNGQPIAVFAWGWLPGIQVPENPNTNITPEQWPLTGHIPILRREENIAPYSEW